MLADVLLLFFPFIVFQLNIQGIIEATILSVARLSKNVLMAIKTHCKL
jgi:hypothetical protein